MDIVDHEWPVEVAELERCVRSWPHLVGGEDERPVYRALTLNLLVVGPAADETLLRAIVRRLLETDPCLAFLVLLEDDADVLDARFGTRIRQTELSRRMLLEQVVVRAGRSTWPKVPSLVRPLLVEDVPTQLFWATCIPEDTRLLLGLTRLSDQFVYDSTLCADPDAELERLRAVDLPRQDLTELRLKGWRRALAEAFERVAWRPEAEVDATIVHGDTAGTRAAAIVLARWLQRRLGAECRLVAERSADCPSFEPSSLELRFDDVVIQVEHQWPGCDLRVTITLADHCLMPFTSVSTCLSRGDLLAAAAVSLGGMSAVSP